MNGVNLLYAVKYFQLERTCPFCKHAELTRSHRRPLEKVLSGLFLPYRCESCGWRFLVWRGAARPADQNS